MSEILSKVFFRARVNIIYIIYNIYNNIIYNIYNNIIYNIYNLDNIYKLFKNTRLMYVKIYRFTYISEHTRGNNIGNYLGNNIGNYFKEFFQKSIEDQLLEQFVNSLSGATGNSRGLNSKEDTMDKFQKILAKDIYFINQVLGIFQKLSEISSGSSYFGTIIKLIPFDCLLTKCEHFGVFNLGKLSSHTL